MPELPEVEIVKRSLKNTVKYKKIKKIILETNKAEDLNVDGELKGSSPFELEINKKAITIIN